MLRKSEEALTLLAGKGTSGRGILDVAALALSMGLGCRWAAVASRNKNASAVELLALAVDGEAAKVFSYPLGGTPCLEIYRRASAEQPEVFVPDEIVGMFPGDRMLSDLGVVSYRGELFFDIKGDPAGHVFVMDDKPMPNDPQDRAFFRLVTQRVGAEYSRWQAERALQESEGRLLHAAQLANLGYWVWDEVEDKAIYASDELGHIFGYDSGQALTAAWASSEHDLQTVHPDDRERYVSNVADSKVRKTSFQEYRMLRKDGVVRLVQELVEPFFDQEGNVTRTTGVVQDVTEMKEAEIELRQAKEEAERATRAKSRYLANMSHELRTPLNAIIGITEMLYEDAEGEGEEDLIEPLGRISRAGKHLLNLINDVLDLSKIEAGKLELNREDVDIAALIDDIAMTAQPLAERNGNQLVVTCAQDMGPAQADPLRLRQVILNLLSNACKFTEDGRVELDVRGDRYDDRDWVRITVSDTGIGIAPEDVQHLFHEFAQAEESSRKYGGTGLGLAISHRLCRLMGGDISVGSDTTSGATFIVRLPAAA